MTLRRPWLQVRPACNIPVALTQGAMLENPPQRAAGLQIKERRSAEGLVMFLREYTTGELL